MPFQIRVLTREKPWVHRWEWEVPVEEDLVVAEAEAVVVEVVEVEDVLSTPKQSPTG
jgi:hypothetical protein